MNGCKPVYTQGWTDERKLLMKMVEVYKQVQYIQKRGHNKFHNYKYATEADVNEKVREELSVRNIIMMPGVVNKELRNTTTKSGNTEYIYRVDMEFNFMDAETGESLVVPMSGEGQDVGDKAIFKAISGCQKYALMKAFMIPTGDDPEGDEGVDERNHRGPQPNSSGTSQNTSQGNASSQSQNGSAGHSGQSSDGPTEGQRKMLYAKHNQSFLKGSFDRISDHLGYPVTKFEEVKKSDVNKLIALLDENKAS